jgi:hypothetical protein
MNAERGWETRRKRYGESGHAGAYKRRAAPGTPTRHKRTLVEHEGRQVSLRELALQSRLDFSTVYRRYRKGLRGADLVRPSYAPAEGK